MRSSSVNRVGRDTRCESFGLTVPVGGEKWKVSVLGSEVCVCDSPAGDTSSGNGNPTGDFGAGVSGTDTGRRVDVGVSPGSEAAELSREG